MTPLSEWIIGRRFCATCNRVRQYLAHPDVIDFRCPTCGGETSPAMGPDHLMEELEHG